MALAALLLSILNAVGGLLYAGAQARRDRGRRHEETQPVWVPRIERVPNTSTYVLSLRLDVAAGVDSVEIVIWKADGVAFSAGEPDGGVGKGAPSASHGPVVGGDSVTWSVEFGSPRSTTARLLITSARGRQTWTAIEDVDVPRDVSASFH